MIELIVVENSLDFQFFEVDLKVLSKKEANITNKYRCEGKLADRLKLILKKLAAIISQEGVLQISSQNTRSQLRNKEDAIEKFYQKIEKALQLEKPRKKTKKPKSLDEKRLKEKKLTSEKKAFRKKVDPF